MRRASLAPIRLVGLRLPASRSGLLLLALVATASAGRAQGPTWDDGYHLAGTPGTVRALLEHDDGRGPALYAAGEFETMGPVEAANVARWDGASWEPLGSGLTTTFSSPSVSALSTFDDGTGSALYAGGSFHLAGGAPATGVASWDGTSWAPVSGGIDGAVLALAVHDDGSGPALYASGFFLTVENGTVAAGSIARWAGATWSPVGAGLGSGVRALVVFDDGAGPALYAAGRLGPSALQGVAKWDGTSWTTVGSVPDDFGWDVLCLEVFDDGTGPALYVGGEFEEVDGVPVTYVARWDGASWSPVGTPPFPGPTALRAFDDGTGVALYGAFEGGIRRWTGATWVEVGTPSPEPAYALAAFDVGAGPRLGVGGQFGRAGDAPASSIAAWSGAAWEELGDGLGTNGQIRALEVLDAGDGLHLYAGGDFDSAGGLGTRNIARWDGVAARWSPLDGGLEDVVDAIAVYDDGGGPVLHADEDRFDGQTWTPLVTSGVVNALEVFDDGGGPVLYLGSSFGPVALRRWDGSSVSLVAGFGPSDDVRALAVYDDGAGPALFVGGTLTLAGGSHVANLARWDGVAWSAVGGGTDGAVRSLEVFDDGGGPKLYVGGSFGTAGGVPAGNLASWNGASWSAVGGGTNGTVRSLAVTDVGDGERLYVGGNFTAVGSGPLPANRVASWDGTSWSALGLGAEGGGAVLALRGFHSADGPGLFVGGNGFDTLGGVPSHRLGRWASQGCDGGPTTYCVGELSSAGCVSSIDTTGAPSTTGTNPFALIARDVIPGEAGFILYGFQKANLAFHGGRLCVKAPIQRWLPPKIAKSTGSPPCTGVLSRDFNARIQSGADAQLTAGQTVFAQWLQRDPADPGGNLENLTNAVRFVICP